MSEPVQGEQAGADLDFEGGRYLYCVVSADEGETFSAEGVDDQPVSLVAEDGVAAVVHPVDSVYDTDDLNQVRQWLLTHQDVVDAAGEAFGTPLPFRFDTIFKGGDDTVAEWLRDNHDELAEALDWLAGRWEYRISVAWDEDAVGETLKTEDEELRELTARMDEASSGTGYLLETQFDQRLAELLQARSETLEDRIVEDVEPYAVEIRRSGDASVELAEGESSGFDTAVQLSVLADSDHEEDIGEQLEPLAARPEYEVRYTGPWPPYSHAPEIGGDEEQ